MTLQHPRPLIRALWPLELVYSAASEMSSSCLALAHNASNNSILPSGKEKLNTYAEALPDDETQIYQQFTKCFLWYTGTNRVYKNTVPEVSKFRN